MNYPKAVAFVLCSKLFESFAANGVRSKINEFVIAEPSTNRCFFNFSRARTIFTRFTEFHRGVFDIVLPYFQFFQPILPDIRRNCGRQLLWKCENNILSVLHVFDRMDRNGDDNVSIHWITNGVSALYLIVFAFDSFC